MNKIAIAAGCVLMLSIGSRAESWTESIKVQGDLRYRHELIDQEGDEVRNRHRIRARIGIEGKVNETTQAFIHLATGSDDPVSTNQTLDDGFSGKSIMLNMAYLKIQPEQITGLSISGGKFENPFFKPGKSELIWDSDFNPEGGVANFQKDFNNITLNVIGAGLWIDERSSDKDSWLAAGQGLMKFQMNEKKSNVAFGGGYFNYVNTAGYKSFFDSENPMGNSVDTNGHYTEDYQLLELCGEGSHHFGKIPVTVMGDFITNTAADSNNTGWLAGIIIGKAKKPGSWGFRYIYRQLEKDAVIGMYTDSDFRGGGTDAKGHEMGGDYQIAGNSTFSVTYFINTIGLGDAQTDFNRLQVDLQLKF